MMGKSVSLKDIAERAGVSVATVSAALNGTGRISEGVRLKISEVARAMNYEPNLAARLLKQKRCQDIGLIISDLPRRLGGSGFFQPMIYHFIKLCDEQGIRCQIEYHDPETKDSQVPTLLTNGFAGGVLYGGAVGTATRAWLQAHPSFPVVFFEDTSFENSTHTRYDVGAYRMVQHLAALGHRRLALLAGLPHYGPQRGIREGYCRAIGEFGLEDLSLEEPFLLENDVETMRTGVLHSERLLSRPVRPTALVLSDARLAKAALYTALRLGLRVPEELSLFTCGSEHETEQVYPALSAIRWNASEAIRRSYHLLRSLMEGHVPLERHLEIEPILTLRDSTARHKESTSAKSPTKNVHQEVSGTRQEQ